MKRPSDDLYGLTPEDKPGPGDSNCPHCKGDGVLLLPGGGNSKHREPPSYRRCKCILHRDILANVERAMKGLSKGAPLKKSPLLEQWDKSIWVTASPSWLTAHLRHAAVRQPPTWYFKVISDVDLMTAWLASAALKGKEILDPDSARVSLTHLTLVDLIVPPQLLVIRVGVKAARNVATPEVLLETLIHREHLGLPTWVWDQPGWKLEGQHNAYSDAVGRYLSTWNHLTVMSNDPLAVPQTQGGFTEWLPPVRTAGNTLSSSVDPAGASFLDQQIKDAGDPWKDHRKRQEKERQKRKPAHKRTPYPDPSSEAPSDATEIAELLGASKTLSLYKTDK